MKIPKRIRKRSTSRQWKQQKRYEARVLARMVGDFCFGMAFSPARVHLDDLRKAVKSIRAALSVEKWGN